MPEETTIPLFYAFSNIYSMKPERPFTTRGGASLNEDLFCIQLVSVNLL